MTTTLVAGATGYLGRFIVAELHRRGHRVRAIVRSRERAESPGPWEAPSLRGLVDEWAVGDVTDPTFAADVAEGMDHVVSALGVTRQKANPWSIDYRANLAILRSAERHRSQAFCFVNVIGGDECPAQLTRAKTAFARELASSPVPHRIISPSGYFSDMMQLLVGDAFSFSARISGSIQFTELISRSSAPPVCFQGRRAHGMWEGRRSSPGGN